MQALLPQGGGTLGVDDWLAVVDEHYLRGFLPAGGASIKLAVAGSDETAQHLVDGLRTRADRAGLAWAAVDAASTRVHLVDQVFAAISQQLDHAAVARGWLRQAYGELGLEPDHDLAVRAVAQDAQLDERELQRSLRRRLEQTLLTDATLPRDLRTAVLRLAQHEAGFSEAGDEDGAAALAWLRAEQVPAGVLRRAGLGARITRSSARPLLVSLGHLLAGSRSPGASGLVVVLDLERLGVSPRPPVEQRDGLYYSRAAVLDAWEVLRQLIDATEHMSGMLVVVVVPPELVVDERRGLPSYSAMQLRVADEVRDRRRVNPFASLVRLDVRLEAVR